MDPLLDGINTCHSLQYNRATYWISRYNDGGRHEMLNEINKKEVYQYIYNWIEKRIFNDKQ